MEIFDKAGQKVGDVVAKARERERVRLADRLALLDTIDTGLRLSELAGLRIGDLLPDGYLRVRGKGGKERLVPLGTVTEARLPDYLAHSRPRPIGRDVDHVFLARDGRPLTSAAIQHALRRLGGRAGLDGVPLPLTRR